ncbi:hypothetical protein NE865_04248 [Phthorimaea operculella]|nr:hypothetical protein NE865_04248 [Phthorimaea operculella]
MSFSCSKCDFTANFESALIMHRQLHHGEAASLPGADQLPVKTIPDIPLKIPSPEKSPTFARKYNLMKLGSRTSATRIFGKLRAKICHSKMFSHPEDPLDRMLNSDFSSRSECTSKALHLESPSRLSAASNVVSNVKEPQTYACHLCSFEADRITVLDRHLLNDHKIGLDSLLQLVLAKTKDGLVQDSPRECSTRQPYYKPVTCVDRNGDVFGNGEFVLDTAAPKIKLVKHSACNTDLTWMDIPELLSEQLDSITKDSGRTEKNDLLEKMQTLNSYMCKFVNSSNTLKRALSRTPGSQYSPKRDDDELMFDLKLGGEETPRSTRGNWKKAYSDKLERYKSKRTINSDKFRSEKSKLSSESYYF